MESNEMYWKKITITPDAAKKLLATNPRNRSIRKVKVKMMEDALRNGKFETTHQGIAVSKDYVLQDGHHRLTAIVNTGIPATMWVCFNAPVSTRIDTGNPRSERDSLYMAGIVDKGTKEYNILTYPLCNFILARSMSEQRKRTELPETKHKIYMLFKSYIDDVIEMTNNAHGGKGRTAVVLYAMLCALYAGVSKDVVQAWYQILSTGDFYVEGDDELTRAGRSVLHFKKILETKKVWVSGSNTGERDEAIKKAESSIKFYSMRYPATKIYGEWCYPQIKVAVNSIGEYVDATEGA